MDIKKKHRLILLLIVALAIVLRVWGLDNVPPELFGDELDVGYQSYSILRTGRDYSGQMLPTYMHSFAEWRAPLLMYATAPFIALFGLNEWGVRMAPAFFGIVNVLLFYLLLNITFKKPRLSLVGAFLMAIIPWHLQYSRAGFEVTLLMSLLLAGPLCFIKGTIKPLYLYLAATFFSLTFYTYSTANLFTPFLIFLLIITNIRELKRLPLKHTIFSSLLFILISIPIGFHIFFGAAAERYKAFSFFSDPGVVAQVEEKRNEVGANPIEAVFHNRPIVWGRHIINSYFISLSPQFLFIDGDVTFRHSVHEIGPLYWIMLPMIMYGLYAVSASQKNKYRLFWFGWLLMAPIPAALTRDGSIHATRLFLLIPPLIAFAAYGFDAILRKNFRFKKLLAGGVVFILIFEIIFYVHRYWVHYPIESWRWWHYGYKDAITYMKEHEKEYNTIVFNDSYEPTLLRFLFWWKYPPVKMQERFGDSNRQENILTGFDGQSLENRYYFGIRQEDTELMDFLAEDMMYLVSQRDEVAGDWDWEESPPAYINVLKTVRNPYGEPIFYVVTLNSQTQT